VHDVESGCNRQPRAPDLPHTLPINHLSTNNKERIGPVKTLSAAEGAERIRRRGPVGVSRQTGARHARLRWRGHAAHRAQRRRRILPHQGARRGRQGACLGDKAPLRAIRIDGAERCRRGIQKKVVARVGPALHALRLRVGRARADHHRGRWGEALAGGYGQRRREIVGVGITGRNHLSRAVAPCHAASTKAIDPQEIARATGGDHVGGAIPRARAAQRRSQACSTGNGHQRRRGAVAIVRADLRAVAPVVSSVGQALVLGPRHVGRAPAHDQDRPHRRAVGERYGRLEREGGSGRTKLRLHAPSHAIRAGWA